MNTPITGSPADPSPDPVDLYLSPDVVWVLKAVAPARVRRVITYDGPVSRQAAQAGIEVLTGDANKLAFEPSPIGLSVHYPVRIGAGLLSRYRVLYNLHPGYLPWCRGLSSVNWAIWEGAPAGATLHEMSSELDAGPIVDRIEVAYGPDALCGEVQRRVNEAERELFQQYWPRITSGETLPARPQAETGSAHTRADTARFLRRLSKQDHWRSMTGEELVAALRSFGSLDLHHGGRVLRLYLTARSPGSVGGGD